MATIKGSTTENGITFVYAEVSSGQVRGFRFSAQGMARSEVEFTVAPNPHDNPDHNNDGQEEFYATIAREMAGDCKVKRKKAAFEKIIAGSTKPDEYTKRDCTKLGKKKQEEWVDNHNETELARLEAEANGEYRTAIAKNFRSRYTVACTAVDYAVKS